MIRDKYFLDPTCKLYLPFDRLDGAEFSSKDQYGHKVTNDGTVLRFKSRYFGGNGQFLIGELDVLDFTSEDFTYLFGIKCDDLSEFKSIIDRGSIDSTGYLCYVQTDGQLRFYTYQTGASQYTRTAPGGIEVGKDYAVGISRSGSDVQIYVNGVDVTAFSQGHVDPDSHTGHLIVGGLFPEGITWFEGNMRYLAAYGEAKPALWFETMYQEAVK